MSLFEAQLISNVTTTNIYRVLCKFSLPTVKLEWILGKEICSREKAA